LEFDGTTAIFNDVRGIARRNHKGPAGRARTGDIAVREFRRPESSTVLIVAACPGDHLFLNAFLGESLPALSYPCPVVITGGEGPGRAKVYWKGSRVPEYVSDEALQAESEQLLYCSSGEKALSMESRFWLQGLRFIRIERDNRLLRGGLRLILLAGCYGNIHKQFPAIVPFADAVVFAGPGMRAVEALGQRFLSVQLYGTHRRDVFFVMDQARCGQGEQEDMLRHYLGPVFTGKGGLVDEALYAKRVFRVNISPVTRGRVGQPGFEARVRGAPGLDSGTRHSGVQGFEAALFEYLDINASRRAGRRSL
jgi:hypothetical protein